MALISRGMGSILFLLGLGLAVISAFMQIEAWMLVVVGLLVGYLNIKVGESVKSILSALALGSGSALLATVPTIGVTLGPIFINIATYALAVVLVPALLTFYKAAKS